MEQIKIPAFLSYAREDEVYKSELLKYLAILRQDKLEIWHKGDIKAGEQWNDLIKQKLKEARLILCLISADFLASSYIDQVELAIALKKEKQEKIHLVPILIRPADVHNTSLGKFQMIPKNGKPVTSWKNMDEAWMTVVEEIRASLPKLEQLTPYPNSSNLDSTSLKWMNELLDSPQPEFDKTIQMLRQHRKERQLRKLFEPQCGQWIMDNLEALTEYLLEYPDDQLLHLFQIDKKEFKKFIRGHLGFIAIQLEHNLAVEFQELQDFLKEKEVLVNSISAQLYLQMLDGFKEKIKEAEKSLALPLSKILNPVIEELWNGYRKL